MADSVTASPINSQALSQAQISAFLPFITFDQTANLAAPANSNESDQFAPLLQQSSTPVSDNIFVNDTLLSLNTPILSLFNDIRAQPGSASGTGNLTTQQIQDLNVLQQDIELLEEASLLTSPTLLANNTTTVDLSARAAELALLNANSNGNTQTEATLTAAQIQQAAAILQPLANQPLTPALLVQIQARLTATDVNPLGLTLNNLFMIMGTIASMQTAQTQTKANNASDASTDTETVAPVGAVDRVAIEDSRIL